MPAPAWTVNLSFSMTAVRMVMAGLLGVVDLDRHPRAGQPVALDGLDIQVQVVHVQAAPP